MPSAACPPSSWLSSAPSLSLSTSLPARRPRLDADLVIDAVIGYSLAGPPRDGPAGLIRAANQAAVPVLALDVPGGGDAATGHAHDPSVRATATLTLALPKTGLRTDPGRGHAGELYLADIGVPPELYSRPPLNLEVGHIFAREEIIRLW